MADKEQNEPQPKDDEVQLRGGAYEIIQNRLKTHSKDLRDRIDQLNTARREAFGAVENKLLASERISTNNNCVPRDMVPIGDRFICGYNVFVGLRPETTLQDVFAVYAWQEDSFSPCPLDLIQNDQFLADFKNLYRYYKRTTFAKFAVIGHHLFMVFRVGRDVKDVKTFKWLIRGDALDVGCNQQGIERLMLRRNGNVLTDPSARLLPIEAQQPFDPAYVRFLRSRGSSAS